jgi:WG containing repeat
MPFYENLSAAKQNGNWGFVNKKNVWVIKPTFKDVSFFVKGYALVLKANKEFAFINKNGKEFEIGDVAQADENGI